MSQLSLGLIVSATIVAIGGVLMLRGHLIDRRDSAEQMRRLYGHDPIAVAERQVEALRSIQQLNADAAAARQQLVEIYLEERLHRP